jgi:hypothetical protein
MHPVLLVFPILFFMSLRGGRYRWRAYFITAAVFAIMCLSARFAVHYLEPRNSEKCRGTLPVSALQVPFNELGFHTGSLLAETNHLAGNLVILFPQARVWSMEDRSLRPKIPPQGPLLLVWVEDPLHRPQAVRDRLAQEGIGAEEPLASGFVEAPFPQFPSRVARFGYRIIGGP